jgi:hypothetical protein
LVKFGQEFLPERLTAAKPAQQQVALNSFRW